MEKYESCSQTLSTEYIVFIIFFFKLFLKNKFSTDDNEKIFDFEKELNFIISLKHRNIISCN
jgi:hypothetical protein